MRNTIRAHCRSSSSTTALSDRTAAIVREILPRYPWLTLLDLEKNGGKANALNRALTSCKA